MPDVPAVLDWVLGGLVALVGLVFAVVGSFLFLGVDRGGLETAVAEDEVQVEGMTEAEFVDLAMAMVTWVGPGLVVTGLAMIALGVAYVVHRRRVRDRAAAGERTSDYVAHALLGAVVSGVTSFVPISPVIGGGLAGYLERGDSERTISVGAASGALLGAPFFVVGLFFAAGVAAGFAAIGDGGLAAMAAVIAVVGAAISLGVSAGLGAAGGWIGGKIAER